MAIECSRCGTNNRDNSPHCVNCGNPLSYDGNRETIVTTPPQSPTQYQTPCINCNRMINPNLAICPYCNANQRISSKYNKTTAAVLAILLGGLGVHKFYLGQTVQGIIYLVFSWTFIPAIAGVIEGIIYLTMSDFDFSQKYR